MPIVQLATAEWELILAVWLLSGRYQIGAWMAGILTFIAFGGVSAYLGWAGVASCGCFGEIPATPWHTLVLDLTILLLLATARPRTDNSLLRTPGGWRRAARSGLGNLAGALGWVCALTVAGTLAYGSSEHAIARLRGEQLSVEPRYVDLGTAPPGETLEANVKVKNWSNREVRLIGGTSDCSCLTTSGLPRTLGPGETATLPVRLTLANDRRGVFVRKAEIWTDCDTDRVIKLRLGGRAR